MRIKRSQKMELIYIIGSSRTQSEELIYYYTIRQPAIFILYSHRTTHLDLSFQTLCNYISIEKYLILYSNRIKKRRLYSNAEEALFFPLCHSLIGF